MTERKINIQRLVGRVSDRTPIAVLVNPTKWDEHYLLELAEQRDWQLLSLGSTRGNLPPAVTLRGALINMVPGTPLAQSLLDRGVPTVRIGNAPHPKDHLIPAVLPDKEAQGRLAAEHFAERDFKHVAFVSRTPWGMNLPMYEGFCSRAEALGCQCHLLQFDERSGRKGPELHEWRKEIFTQWIVDVPKPVGLFAFNDSTAALQCQWVLEAGLHVPEDVAVLGLGNNEFICRSAAVPLSTIVSDPRAVSVAAVSMLDQLMAGDAPGPAVVQVPPVGIDTRQSTDVLAATDPNVVRALRFMWDHVTHDLSVDQIAKQVGVSRRTLEKAFQRDLGRGINKEFQRRRLEKARELLTQTNYQVAEVAEALRFSSARQFCRAFRESFGLTPGNYRKQSAEKG